MKKTSAQVGIIMGSESDWEIMKEAGTILDEFGISYEVEVVSAHRTPKRMMQYGEEALRKGFKVIIAGAGGAAHLPGMMASLTTLPVIGVPVALKKLDGLDSLLSIVQMPRGIPVATVAIDNATNAGILAARILGSSDSKLTKKLQDYQKSLEDKVKVMNKNLKAKKK